MSRAYCTFQIIRYFILVDSQVDCFSYCIIKPVLVENVVLEPCARYGLNSIFVRLLLIDLESSGRNAVVAVDLAALHCEKLRIVFLHVVENRSVEFDISAPVVVIARNSDIAFRVELLDHERSCADRVFVKICSCIKIDHSALRAGKVVLKHWVYILAGVYYDLVVSVSLPVKISKILESLIDLSESLDILYYHVRCERIPVGEANTIFQSDGPCSSVSNRILCQTVYSNCILIESEQGFRQSVDRCIPSVIFFVYI